MLPACRVRVALCSADLLQPLLRCAVLAVADWEPCVLPRPGRMRRQRTT